MSVGTVKGERAMVKVCVQLATRFGFEVRTMSFTRMPCVGEQVEWEKDFAPYVSQVRHYLRPKQRGPVGEIMVEGSR